MIAGAEGSILQRKYIMKKFLFGFLIIIITAGCVFAQNNTGSVGGSGLIRELAGTVEIKKPGDTAFSAANAGDLISRDTIISTGFKSTAIVEVGSAVINVRPLTRLSLTEIAASSGIETINVNLQAGRVRVDVNPPAGTRAAMTVSSPVATASVRGTSFEFDTRNLSVNHGTVSFSGNRGPSVRVNGGNQSSVEQDGRTADPAKAKSGRLRPQAPVGADPSSGTGGDTAGKSGGTITVLIDYSGRGEDTPTGNK